MFISSVFKLNLPQIHIVCIYRQTDLGGTDSESCVTQLVLTSFDYFTVDRNDKLDLG